jgi:hypothetical protein
VLSALQEKFMEAVVDALAAPSSRSRAPFDAFETLSGVLGGDLEGAIGWHHGFHRPGDRSHRGHRAGDQDHRHAALGQPRN